jgi:ribosomal protein L19E
MASAPSLPGGYNVENPPLLEEVIVQKRKNRKGSRKGSRKNRKDSRKSRKCGWFKNRKASRKNLRKNYRK